MFFLRRSLLAIAFFVGWGLHAQGFVQIVPFPKHAIFYGMPVRLDAADTQTMVKALTDAKEDAFPSSTASRYYGIAAGNTHGPATNDSKNKWYARCVKWMTGKAEDLGDLTHLGVAATENAIEWIDGIVAPEVTMREEQMASFQRMLKAYQLFRQMEVMAKSWTGSIFKFDVLDIVPVFEQVTLDDFGLPSNGVRVGIKYKDKDDSKSILAAFGLDNPHMGPYDRPRMFYKGPQRFSDISFEVEASPYQGTATGSGALRIGQKGNEILDRVFFEGIMGRNMARGGLYYTAKAGADRPSPKLLKEHAEEARQVRMSQIMEEAEAISNAKGIPFMDALDRFKDEMAWWNLKPQAIYDNQMQRLNRYRDELAPIQNDVVKNESPEKLAENSDPNRKNFLDGLFNLYSKIGDSVSDVVNAATGEEDDGDNPGPRLLYKSRLDYTKATHAAYQEALAIRRYLFSKIQADSQRGEAEGFQNLWETMQEQKRVLAKAQVKVTRYQDRANKVLQYLDQLGLTTDDIINPIRGN